MAGREVGISDTADRCPSRMKRRPLDRGSIRPYLLSIITCFYDDIVFQAVEKLSEGEVFAGNLSDDFQ